MTTPGQLGIEAARADARITAAINLLASRAIELGADANDTNGAVRELVSQNGLGFNAWFCVCCEIADRNARAQGFKNQSDRAATLSMGKKIVLPDGYNGHMMVFYAEPVATDGDLVKLRVAEPGKEYMFAWKHKSVFNLYPVTV
jgi:hypothetical protein